MKQSRHFRVLGVLDNAGGVQSGRVTITPDGFFQVRPLRRRRVYALPLSTVADIVCKRIMISEVAAERAEKKKRRRRRRRS